MRMPRGRPKGSGVIKLTPAVADAVLERMWDGEILTAICRDYDLTPGAFAHKAEHDEVFAQRYARARQEQAHALAMDVVRIADEETDPHRARVRCDARKWVAARIDPKNYGDKSTTALTGADGVPLIPVLNVVLSKPSGGGK